MYATFCSRFIKIIILFISYLYLLTTEKQHKTLLDNCYIEKERRHDNCHQRARVGKKIGGSYRRAYFEQCREILWKFLFDKEHDFLSCPINPLEGFMQIALVMHQVLQSL